MTTLIEVPSLKEASSNHHKTQGMMPDITQQNSKETVPEINQQKKQEIVPEINQQKKQETVPKIYHAQETVSNISKNKAQGTVPDIFLTKHFRNGQESLKEVPIPETDG